MGKGKSTFKKMVIFRNMLIYDEIGFLAGMFLAFQTRGI